MNVQSGGLSSGELHGKGWDELLTTLVQKNPNNDMMQLLGEQRGQILKHLAQENIDNNELQIDLMKITGTFRSCLISTNLNLDPAGRIMLLYAFRDLTDDLRSCMVEKIQNRTMLTRLWGSLPTVFSNNRSVSEEDFVKQINEIQDAYKDLDTKIQEIATHISFDSIPYENLHEEKWQKANKIVPYLFEESPTHAEPTTYTQFFQAAIKFLSDTVLPTITQAGQKALQVAELGTYLTPAGVSILAQKVAAVSLEKAQEYKDDIVVNAVQPLKPENLFKGQSFKELIASVAEKEYQDTKYLKLPIVRQIADHVVVYWRKNFSENMSVFQEQKNAARLAVRCNTELAHVLEIERKLEKDASEQDFVRKLYPDLTVEQFKEKMESGIVENISCLISKNAQLESKEQNLIGQGVWNRIKKVIKKYTNKLTKKYKQKFVSKKFQKKSRKLKPKGLEALKSAENIATMMGVDQEVKKIENHSELLTYYLIYIATQEMVKMAQEKAATKMINISGFQDDSAAHEAFHASMDRVMTELSQFKPQKEATRTQRATFWLATSIGTTLVSQQKESGILNFTEPAYNELYGAWMDWFTQP